jgi:hypothetical protein
LDVGTAALRDREGLAVSIGGSCSLFDGEKITSWNSTIVNIGGDTLAMILFGSIFATQYAISKLFRK